MEVQLRQLTGNWDRGYALHKHVLSSTYLGDDANGRAKFENIRSEPGEALFLLKYRSDWSKVGPLAVQVQHSLAPLFGKIGFMVPMPASTARLRQPVNELTKEIGRLMGVPVSETLISKAPAVQGEMPLKDLATKADKSAALAGRFTISDTIQNDGRWNVLVVDDLFDTGASMEAACAALRSYHKVAKIYVAAITWK